MACLLTTDKHREWEEGKKVSAEFLAKLDQEFVTITGGLEAKAFNELMSIDKIRGEYLTAINNINNHGTEEANNNGGASLQGGQNQSGTTRLAQGIQENSQQGTGGTKSSGVRVGNEGRLERAERSRRTWLADRNPSRSSGLQSVVDNITAGVKTLWKSKNKQLEDTLGIRN